MSHPILSTKGVRASAKVYVPAFLEACTTARIADPAGALFALDDFPKVLRVIENAEFIAGWFHALEDATGMKISAIWRHFAAEFDQPSAKRAARSAAKPAPKRRAKPAPAPPTRKRTPHTTITASGTIDGVPLADIARAAYPHARVVEGAPRRPGKATGKVTVVEPETVPRAFNAPGMPPGPIERRAGLKPSPAPPMPAGKVARPRRAPSAQTGLAL